MTPQPSTNEVRHNPWSLIIYRPENNGDLNDVRCWLKIQDSQTGEDVTYTKIKAKYEWVSMTKKLQKNPKSIAGLFIPDTNIKLFKYQKTYYLSGGMAAHLTLPKGKYKISVYTPKDKTNLFKTENPDGWTSNVFEYDTENPAKVIFVIPVTNDNGFYNGEWKISSQAPKWFKFTIPQTSTSEE